MAQGQPQSQLPRKASLGAAGNSVIKQKQQKKLSVLTSNISKKSCDAKCMSLWRPCGWRDGSVVKSGFCSYRRPILVSSTQQFTTMCDPSSRRSIVLFWSLWALSAHATQTYTQVKHTHMQIIKRNKNGDPFLKWRSVAVLSLHVKRSSKNFYFELFSDPSIFEEPKEANFAYFSWIS